MKYVSTRKKSPAVSFSEALTTSLAPDGGLYVPAAHPSMAVGGTLETRVLAPYLAGDPLLENLNEMVHEAFTFSTPLKSLAGDTAVLELFHGPTAAFKDVGARFLAAALARLPSTERRLVLVATSGDTGGAVAAAFFEKPGIDVAILFPKGRISPRQEKQLTAWGGNVRAFAVRGTFDDCQRMVKAAFTAGGSKHRLLSANSINIGRLVPQQVYYARAAEEYRARYGVAPNFVIPTGNLGNAVACLWAKRMGFPIGKVVLATNANRAIPDYFGGGAWETRATIATLANAMDVGNASNMERLLALYPDRAALCADVSAVSVSDEAIRAAIRNGVETWGEVWCPHTAAAVSARETIGGAHWVIVATAHPAKFESIVEPLIGKTLAVPESLKVILDRPSHAEEIAAGSDLAAVL